MHVCSAQHKASFAINRIVSDTKKKNLDELKQKNFIHYEALKVHKDYICETKQTVGH